MALLDAYNSTNALISTLMKSLKQSYESRNTLNIKTTLRGMELLKNNKMKKFGPYSQGVTNQATTRIAKAGAKRETKYQAEKEAMDKVIRGVERVVNKPKLNTKDGDTEAPTYEVEFIKDYFAFGEAWEAGVKKLIKLTEAHMKTKPDIKVSIGCTFQVKNPN